MGADAGVGTCHTFEHGKLGQRCNCFDTTIETLFYNGAHNNNSCFFHSIAQKPQKVWCTIMTSITSLLDANMSVLMLLLPTSLMLCSFHDSLCLKRMLTFNQRTETCSQQDGKRDNQRRLKRNDDTLHERRQKFLSEKHSNNHCNTRR